MKVCLFAPALVFLVLFPCGDPSTLSAQEERQAPRRPNAMPRPEAPLPAAPVEQPGRTGSAAPAEATPDEKSPRRFGPYEAIVFDENVLQEVVVADPNNTIWLRLRPDHRTRRITVKISNRRSEDYRIWYTTGDYELVSPADAGRPANALTDWLRTEANYVEYWIDDELFLHLRRIR